MVVSDAASARPSTRDLLIKILGEEWPLTIKQIHLRVAKESGQSISYQAVHKLVLSLFEEGILQKDANAYSLSFEWIRKMHKSTELLEETYLKKKYSLADLKENSSINLNFTNIMDMVRFVVFDFFAFEDTENKPIACKVWNAWPPIALNDQEFQRFTKILAKKKFYQLVTNETSLDKMSAKCLTEMGAKTKVGIPCDLDFDVLVSADFVAIVHFPKVKRQFRTVLKAIKFLNGPGLRTLYRFLFQTKVDIFVTVTKNSELAERLRKDVLDYFK